MVRRHVRTKRVREFAGKWNYSPNDDDRGGVGLKTKITLSRA